MTPLQRHLAIHQAWLQRNQGTTMITPTPMMVRAMREAAGLTQAQAAEMIHAGGYQRWSEYERGLHSMPLGQWELFCIKTGNHELYKPVPGNPVPTKDNTSALDLLAHRVNTGTPNPHGPIRSTLTTRHVRMKNRP